MSILTLDAVIAGLQAKRAFAKVATPTLVAGRPQSLWQLAGIPGPGLAIATTATGVPLSSTSAQVAGQIPHTDPGSGNSYLADFAAQSNQIGTLILADRLLQCGGISTGTAIATTSATAQTINTAALPARDNAGSTNGDGVLWAVEVQTATGAGTPTLTFGYTNQAGTSGQTATNIDTTVATSAIGAFYRMGLAAGDSGMRSVQTYTQSATWTSGTVGLIAYRQLAMIGLTLANASQALDALTAGMPQLFNGTVPFLIFVPNGTTAASIAGEYAEAQG